MFFNRVQVFVAPKGARECSPGPEGKQSAWNAIGLLHNPPRRADRGEPSLGYARMPLPGKNGTETRHLTTSRVYFPLPKGSLALDELIELLEAILRAV